MIPKIITISEGDTINEIIVHFAKLAGIAPSHTIVVLPEKEELTVDQIHNLRKDLQVTFSKKVLVVLVGVDNSSNEVQNSLLKFLEEDSMRIDFLILVLNPIRLVSTILSRSTLLESFNKVRKQPIIDNDSSLIFSFQNNSDISKEEAVERIDTYIQSSSMRNNKMLSHLLTMRKLIIDNNMNPVLALDSILIFLSKTSTMSLIHDK